MSQLRSLAFATALPLSSYESNALAGFSRLNASAKVWLCPHIGKLVIEVDDAR